MRSIRHIPTLLDAARLLKSQQLLLDLPCEIVDGRQARLIFAKYELFVICQERILFYQQYQNSSDVLLSYVYDERKRKAEGLFVINIRRRNDLIVHSPILWMKESDACKFYQIIAFLPAILKEIR